MFVTKPFKTLLEELSDNKHLNFKNFRFMPERLLELQCHLRNYIQIFGSLDAGT